jgi:hypothetical protein
MSEVAQAKGVRKHRLLIFEIMSKRLRNKLLFLLFILLGIGVYDFFYQILGDNVWFLFWIVILVVFLLWFYYAFMMPRASIQIRPKSLRLRGPLMAFNVSYGRIHSVTSAQMSQHFPFDSLKGREQGVLEPLYNRTCVFIELRNYPKAFRWRHLWFPKYLFGTSRPGLVCVTEDWLTLTRDVEAYRGERYERVHAPDRGESRSLAAKVLTDD